MLPVSGSSSPKIEYKAGLYVWMISTVAALGGLLFGYDFVVIGGAKPFYEKFFALSDSNQQGWAMSCALVGCLVGALVSGESSDHLGRKKLLIVAALLFAVSSIGTGLAPSFGWFVAWRIAGGMAIGLASNLSPLYISEVSPAALRGRLVSLNQLTIVAGILLAQVMNWLIARPVSPLATAEEILHSWNGQVGWRWMFGVTAVPAVFFLAGMFLVPESPRWLAQKGRTEAARGVLARIGGEAYAGRAMEEIAESLGQRAGRADLRMLLEPRLRRVLVLGVVLAVFQQWCGINVIFNYAEEVFASAGYHVSDVLFNIVITGVTNLLFTLMTFAMMDRFGRRGLMLAGSVGMAVIYGLLGGCFATGVQGAPALVLVGAAIACFAMTLGPTAWVVIAEIFPNRIRGTAMSIAVAALWIGCFVLTYTFPFLNGALGAAGTFWIYGGICVAGAIYIFFELPETRGKTLERIEQEMA